jgi:predicted RNase H-like nuclease
MLASAGAVIGIDAGWSEKRSSSAACVLEWSNTKVLVHDPVCFRATSCDIECTLGEAIAKRTITVAAVDGPLREDLTVIGAYRRCEQLLTRRIAPVIGKPGQSSSPNGRRLNQAANTFARWLLANMLTPAHLTRAPIVGKEIVEAFPTSFLGSMLDQHAVPPHKRGKRSDAYYEKLAEDRTLVHLVERLLPGRCVPFDFAAVRNHDKRAAVACALTALCVAAQQYRAVGNKDGYIILPPVKSAGATAGLQPWALKLIEANETEP